MTQLHTTNVMRTALVVLASMSSASSYPYVLKDYRVKDIPKDKERSPPPPCGKQEQFMQIETICELQNFERYTMKWTQLTTTCGKPLTEDPAIFEATFGEEEKKIVPTNGNTQLVIYACAPFGSYQLDLNVVYANELDVKKDEGDGIFWEVKTGDEEINIWGSWSTEKYRSDPKYSMGPGLDMRKSWPIPGELDPYMKTMWSGPDVNGENCDEENWPGILVETLDEAEAEFEGCFKQETRGKNILVDSKKMKIDDDLTTAQKCNEACEDFEVFSLFNAGECYCGKGINPDTTEGKCEKPCRGKIDTFCGGKDAVNVFKRGRRGRKMPEVKARMLGCFEDDKNDRILKGSELSEPKYMSEAVCANYCRDYPVFGLQFSHECYCGFYEPEKQISDRKCNFKCAGNPRETCGGYNAMTVFENKGSPLVRHRGCYPDSRHHRILNRDFKRDRNMTPHLCKKLCPKGTTAYGVEYGEECFCSFGDDWKSVRPIDNEHCDSPCRGDRHKFCGGRNAIDIYEYESDHEDECPTPTPAPTRELTPAPAPTLDPTSVPTLGPTAPPTWEPTAAQTWGPTVAPTWEPNSKRSNNKRNRKKKSNQY